ncbi:hypothetical protein [Marinobacter sp. DY40_1A1]|uniref:hypothetical protein n=1 Tax=Marinobacter sp. DY40_1A1 TaxID=2583229 RepID=UPI001D11B39D|nr:hypothetical protein [Marinobacter sp. DY40_1A1]
MNRYKTEETRARQNARAGKTHAEIAELDQQETLQASIYERARKIHIERFPEEYDHYYDSIADASDRASGINPMSKEYIERVTTKRKKEGVSPLEENGLPTANDTWEIALAEAERQLQPE